MISAEIAAKQIKRLAQMKNYPREDEARKELVKALQIAASEEQAKLIVFGILDQATSETKCPMPAEIKAAVSELRQESRPDPLCHICGGDGWRTVTRHGYSGSDRCMCWAPRPAPQMEFVPLPGSPGYVQPTFPSREEISEEIERLKSAVKL